MLIQRITNSALVLCVLVSGSVTGADEPNQPGLAGQAPAATVVATHVIDPNVYSGPRKITEAIRGSRPLAAMVDRSGVKSIFVSNEVIVRAPLANAVAFAKTYSGSIVRTIGPSTPAPGQPKALVSKAFTPLAFVVRVNPSAMSLAKLDINSGKLGFNGLSKYSSKEGAQLAALIFQETVKKNKVSFNFTSVSHVLTSTAEQRDQNGVSDAFLWKEFDSGVGGQKAWAFVAAKGIARRVRVAIIDGGFWLNSKGVPCDLSFDAKCGPSGTAKGSSDLPAAPLQFDTIGDGSLFAGGPNPNNCSGGKPCPWHGNRSASVATGVLNNRSGATGTGGQVGVPILLKVDGSDDTIIAALIDAVGYGADIINLSLGAPCNVFCRSGRSMNGYTYALDTALDSGVLVVASAGNDGIDARTNNVWPCQYSNGKGNGVYCVGALNSATDTFGYSLGDDGNAASYSNFGTTVNIWAPTNIRAMPDGATGGRLAVHSGTSASAPYVTGVAAMMKAINPTLSGNQIKDIIGNAPFTPGTSIFGLPYHDPVSFVIQPYKAVVAAAGGYHLAPEIRIISPANGAHIVTGEAGVGFQSVVADVNDGSWPLSGYAANGPTQVSWVSDVDGPLATSGDTVGFFDFRSAAEGPRRVTATVKNSAGASKSAAITISITHPHVAPSPIIVWPANGANFQAGTYTVTGYAKSTDPGELGNVDCSKLVWNSSIASTPIPGSNGQCQARIEFAAGLRGLELAATGKYGDTGTTMVFVNVSPPTPQLVLQIVQPKNGVTEVSTNGGSNISLSGTATPSQSDSILGYAWSWYKTAAGPLTSQFVRDGLSQDLSWNIAGTGLCPIPGIIELVSLRLDATEFNSAFQIVNSGSSTVDFAISCQKLQ